MLQSLNCLTSPLLDSLQHVSLVLESPALDTGLQMWPHQCWLDGKVHLPWPAGSTVPNAAQGTISLLCHKGTLLAHGRLGVHQEPQVCFCSVAPQLGGTYHILVHGIVPPQGQDFALPFAELHEVPLGPFLQLDEILLDGSTTLWCISAPPRLASSADLLTRTLRHHPDH